MLSDQSRTSARSHQLHEAFAILKTRGSLDDAAQLSGLSIETIRQAWNSRPANGDAVNPLAHEQTR